MSNIQRNKIFVYNLPSNANKENLIKLFCKCGEIENISIKKNYAFISYLSYKSAEDAIKNFNDITFFGQKICVTYSNSMNERKHKFNKYNIFNNYNNIKSHININNNKENGNNNIQYKLFEKKYNIFSFKKRKERFIHYRKSPNRSFSVSLSD